MLNNFKFKIYLIYILIYILPYNYCVNTKIFKKEEISIVRKKNHETKLTRVLIFLTNIFTFAKPNQVINHV